MNPTNDHRLLYERYLKITNDNQWRFDNRHDLSWQIEIDEIDPRGQCGPIYRPLNETEFYDRISSDIDFKNKMFVLFYD